MERVSVKETKLFIGGVEINKHEAGKIKYPVHPSNVIIISMKNDARRMKENKKNE